MDTATNTNTTAPINATFDKTVDVKDFKFRFKKDKLGNQRSTVEVQAGVPSVEGFIAILEKGGKGLELLQEAAYGVVRDAMSAYLSENENATTLDASKFSWETIANQPASDRRASTISDDDWTAFAQDYAAIMPALTGKTEENIANAILVYTKKFSIVKSNKDVLKMLQAQLAIYVNNTKKGAEFAEIVELLDRKVKGYLAADDVEQLVANL